MKNNDFLDTILARCEELETSTFRTYVLTGLGIFTFIIAFSLYQINSTSKNLLRTIRTNRTLSQQALDLVTRKKILDEKEQTFTELLAEKELKGGIVPFLVSFLQKHGANPESGWQETLESLSVPNNESAEEKRVRLIFRGQTTEQMVNLIEGLRRKPVVMIREIDVKREANTLLLELLIATRITRARA
ncbi:hypothetical protein KAU11_04375 [Candidatus Babeliales bacterium]|nr:hypothetical protein [Candidatus Babeliales bacterium]